MSRPGTIAVIGATGAVGRELLAVLEQRRFRHESIRLFASPRSAGTRIAYRGEAVEVEALTDRTDLRALDVAFLSAGGETSRTLVPRLVDAGVVAIDNSSAFRMADGVPLVVPEINDAALAPVRSRPAGKGAVIANPNCSTIIMLMALTPLHRALGVRRIVVSTYQAVSGAGAAAMEELRAQTRAALDGTERAHRVFPEPCAFNVFSHNSAMDKATGSNVEEQKMADETRKIWGSPVAVMATCIRVPTLRAHAESIVAELEKPATEDQVRELLSRAPGVRLVDDRAANTFPTSIRASGIDDVLVGRIRGDRTMPHRATPKGEEFTSIALFASGDQIRKGAALNAVQIAERLAD